MSEKRGNGTIYQFNKFFDKRVEMARETLSLETMATIAFGLKEVVNKISFPFSFWRAMTDLLEELSESSLETVHASEKQLTASALMGFFGIATTEETIEPHKELVDRTEKTHKELALGLGSTTIIFATVMHKIQQLIQEYHQRELDEVPNKKSDTTVTVYLANDRGSKNKSVKESFKQSKEAFSTIREKREEKRKLIVESLSGWMGFAEKISKTVFEGNGAMKAGLQAA